MNISASMSVLVKNLITALGLNFVSFIALGAPDQQPSVAEAEAKQPRYLLCQNGVNVRTIRVLAKGSESEGGCQTMYTKEGGTEQVVAESWSEARCLSVMNNIRENLKNGDWKCRDISGSRISSSLNE